MAEIDEKEYEEYLNAVFGMESFDPYDQNLLEQQRDEYGSRVPGCYRIKPAKTDG